MRITPETLARRTSADMVFDALYEQIITLKLLPGAKISEADVAGQFSLSRQPVRDAFNRLGNMNLLLIQPQRATLVRKFSISDIQTARFIRLSVELEIIRVAARRWDDEFSPRFLTNLDHQALASKDDDRGAFHRLDQEFHALIAQMAQKHSAFDFVLENKAKVDRICVLSLKRRDEMSKLVTDHRQIFKALSCGDPDSSAEALRTHLSRIEQTIKAVHLSHAEYFDNT
ncbi:MAG: GntR family transcriptional regulator [Paracoccaceae bacterium]|nr:GntR family transcriptional regulator [Paracoccaceae bacterium]